MLPLCRPISAQECEAPRISIQPAHAGGKIVSPTHRPPLPPGKIPGTNSYQRLSRPQEPSAAGRIKSMQNSEDPVRNQTRDLPACSALPQPTAPVSNVGMKCVKHNCKCTYCTEQSCTCDRTAGIRSQHQTVSSGDVTQTSENPESATLTDLITSANIRHFHNEANS